MTIHSPERKVYTENNVTLNVTITGQGYVLNRTDWKILTLWLRSWYVLEFLDATPYIPRIMKNSVVLSDLGDSYWGNVTWFDLPEGSYNLTVYGSLSKNMLSFASTIETSRTVLFAVDATPTRVLILSPDNGTHSSDDVALSFFVNDPVSRVVCKVDSDYLNLAGNTTLTNLSSGAHNLTVYVTDRVGDWVESKTVGFTVAKPELPQTTLVAAVIIASATVVAFGLVAYSVKVKRKRSEA